MDNNNTNSGADGSVLMAEQLEAQLLTDVSSAHSVHPTADTTTEELQTHLTANCTDVHTIEAALKAMLFHDASKIIDDHLEPSDADFHRPDAIDQTNTNSENINSTNERETKQTTPNDLASIEEDSLSTDDETPKQTVSILSGDGTTEDTYHDGSDPAVLASVMGSFDDNSTERVWNESPPRTSPMREDGRRTGGGRASDRFHYDDEPLYFSTEMDRQLTACALNLYDTLVPTEAEINRKHAFFNWLQGLIRSEWPEVKLHMFGSTANRLCVTGSSDVDVCLITPPSFDPLRIIRQIAGLLRRKRMKNVLPLLHARIPIVKFLDPRSGCCCDICVNNILAVHNTRMLHHYSQIDERFSQMAFIIKHWAKQRKINDPYLGTLSSYAYLLMIIYYLQNLKHPVLPVLQDMKSFGRLANMVVQVTVGDHDCTYMNLIDFWMQEQRDHFARNRSSLGKLLVGFFRYYAREFNCNHMVVSIRTRQHLTKKLKGWANPQEQRNFICIEDPFETEFNVGRVVSEKCLETIKFEFRRAHTLLCNTGDLDRVCEPYQRPKRQPRVTIQRAPPVVQLNESAVDLSEKKHENDVAEDDRPDDTTQP